MINVEQRLLAANLRPNIWSWAVIPHSPTIVIYCYSAWKSYVTL